MNAMAVFKHPDGSRSFLLSLLSQPLTSHGSAVELATAPLDGMILPGVTRDSVLSLAREHASGKAKIEGLPAKLRIYCEDRFYRRVTGFVGHRNTLFAG